MTLSAGRGRRTPTSLALESSLYVLTPQRSGKKVAGREMPRALPSGLLYCRSGTFPSRLLTTRMPLAAGLSPTVPLATRQGS